MGIDWISLPYLQRAVTKKVNDSFPQQDNAVLFNVIIKICYENEKEELIILGIFIWGKRSSMRDIRGDR
jgi:hypothetical protein